MRVFDKCDDKNSSTISFGFQMAQLTDSPLEAVRVAMGAGKLFH